MRRCKVCGEQFEALFSFCPIDGTQFGQACSEAPHSDFTLTIVSDIGLTQRLAAELKFLIEQVEQAWPSCRDQPVAFATNQLSQLRKSLSQILGRRPETVRRSRCTCSWSTTSICIETKV